MRSVAGLQVYDCFMDAKGQVEEEKKTCLMRINANAEMQLKDEERGATKCLG